MRNLIAAILVVTSLAFAGCRLARMKVLEESEHSFTVSFTSLLPLRTDAQLDVQVSSLDPRQELTYELKERTTKEISLEIKEHKSPVGYPITVSINCPTQIPTLQWHVTKTITRKVTPRLLPSPQKIGTAQPILLKFNTPIDETSIRRGLAADFAYTLRPNEVNIDGKAFTDTATWLLVPTKPLAHDHKYQVEINENVRSASQVPLGQKYIWELTTVSPLTFLSIEPSDGASNVPITAGILARANRKPVKYKMTVNGIPQPVTLDDERLAFVSPRLFLPDTEYEVELSIEDEYGERTSQTVRFTTATMGDKMWIEVSLWLPNQVRVYRGKTLLREMIASAGAPDTPTPTGWYRINGRGYAFFSYKYQEGAYYWVRFIGNYLFHSIPFDAKQQIKASEAAKLGTPASHGCVRLSIPDAKWIYDNVPDGTVVVIHSPPQFMSSMATDIDETMVFLSNDEELEHFLEGVN